MKSILLCVLAVLALTVPAFACECGPDCKCDPCDCPKVEKQVNIPNDASRLYVSVYAANKDQANKILADSTVQAYKARGAHVNVYYKSDSMYKARFVGTPVPSAYVQNASGDVIWAYGKNCPWRNRHKEEVQPDQDQADEDQADHEEAPPADPQPSPWVVLAVAAAGLAAGAGSKFVQELKAQ